MLSPFRKLRSLDPPSQITGIRPLASLGFPPRVCYGYAHYVSSLSLEHADWLNC